MEYICCVRRSRPLCRLRGAGAFIRDAPLQPFHGQETPERWAPSSSICTDGVSVSIAYERTEQVPYDPEAPTMTDDRLILGIDPGRDGGVYR